MVGWVGGMVGWCTWDGWWDGWSAPSGPDDKEHVPGDLAQIDSLLRTLVEYYEGERGARVIILSEYGIEPVTTPVYLNRVLRAAGQ